MEPVRLGVVGCGVIGQVHVRVADASPLLQPVAVADVQAPAAEALAGRYEGVRAYDSADELIADDAVEAVVVALPAAVRAAVVMRVLAAGKPVLVEKPVGMNAGEVEAMIAARGDVVAACCSSRMRGLPSAAVATEFIAGGALGQVRVVRCRALRAAGPPPTKAPPPWRLNRSLNGGGILVNWGCYDLDYLLGITGWTLRPRVALAQTWTVPDAFSAYAAPGSDAETHVAALVTCDDGIVLSFERAEFVATATDQAWSVLGDRGTLRLDMLPGTNKTMLFDEATPDGVVTRTIWQGEEAQGQDHVGVLEDFARAVRGEKPPRTTLEQALLVQQITDAIYHSAAQGVAAPVGER
jgi:predicted dehydrogenase